METAAMPYQRASCEAAQTQRFHIEVMHELRITSEQYLKAAIQSKSFYLVGANSSPRRIFGLQQPN
jgi:hypothetical protein